MKLLIGMPVYKGVEHTSLSFGSIYENGNLIIIDNGAEDMVKNALNSIKNSGKVIKIIHNIENRMVNHAWNQILKQFEMYKEYTHLAIISSDLILQKGWFEIL